ncbi:MAG: tetratricopeptide repeat protein, partial [Armatimonadota bacterium]|nr:tetratricopeptide repeat protein [Armatimonadota bacterium]
MKCKACGSEVPDGAVFCTLCGVNLKTGTRSNGDDADSAVYPLLATANLFRMRGNWDAAEQKCIEVLRLYPNNATAHNDFGVVFFRLGQYDQAAEHFSQALQINPQYADANNNLRAALAKKEQ